MGASLINCPVWRVVSGTKHGIAPAVVITIALMFVFIPAHILPYDPLSGDIQRRRMAPSFAHIFGTDELGRDIFSRFVYGTRLTLLAATLAIFIGFVFGIIIGAVAGVSNRAVDGIIMRGVDVMLSIQTLLLAITIIAVLGYGTVNVAAAVGTANVAVVARLMRSKVILVRRELYVTMAALAGRGGAGILFLHVIPNSIGAVGALAALELGGAIISVSSLSFLGFGVDPPNPEWGSMMADGQQYLMVAWWISTLPGLCICLLVMALNQLSRQLRIPRIGAW